MKSGIFLKKSFDGIIAPADMIGVYVPTKHYHGANGYQRLNHVAKNHVEKEILVYDFKEKSSFYRNEKYGDPKTGCNEKLQKAFSVGVFKYRFVARDYDGFGDYSFFHNKFSISFN